MITSYLRVALVLPPVQSFLMPYAAPAVLASSLKERYAAETLVVDCGIEWLWSEVAAQGDMAASEMLSKLQHSETYSDALSLRSAFLQAEQILQNICQPWAPELVHLSGRYEPPAHYTNWEEVDRSLSLTRHRLFDRYFQRELIPKLRRMQPQIIGLSIPFDWMVWPAMRLARWLRRCIPDTEIIVAGHAIQRLWHEGEAEFFNTICAHWAAVGDSKQALMDLVEFLSSGDSPLEESPLIRLPLKGSPLRPSFQESKSYAGASVPDFSDLELARYLRPQPILPIPSSDGCFFGRCRFCSRQRSDQNIPYVERSSIDVAESMKRLADQTGTKQFILAGDILSHRFLLSLAQALEREGFTWFCLSTFKGAMARRLSQEDCHLLYRGGCRLILNGLESGSARIRELMGCPTDQDDYDRTLTQLVSAGITPYVTIIFGYPGETIADLMETVSYIQERLNHVVFAASHFQLVPGTPLSQKLLSQPGAVYCQKSVLEGGLECQGPGVAKREMIDRVLDRELRGMFGSFPEFLRSIPVMMQLLTDTSRPPLTT